MSIHGSTNICSVTLDSLEGVCVVLQECPTYGPRATIRPARCFCPAREVSAFYHSLSLVNIFCRNVKSDRFVSIRCVFLSSKIGQNSFSAPGPTGGAYDAPPGSLVGWGGGHPSPFPSPLDAFCALVVWPPTSLKFVHLALRSKRLDTPALVVGVQDLQPQLFIQPLDVKSDRFVSIRCVFFKL